MTMKRIFSVLSLALAAVMALSCYDDTPLKERIDNLEAQFKALNEQVTAIAAIVEAVEKGDYITSVTQLPDGGYKIEFAKGTAITVRDGKDGANAPQIGATKDTDGVYYWTLGGEWLLDAKGNKVPAGVSQPKLKLVDGKWYVSVDGADWALIGPDVACTIQDIAVTEESVIFTLATGETVVVPFAQPLDITFDAADGSTFGESVVINYTITGGTDKNRVAVMSSTVAAEVQATDATTGVITAGSVAFGAHEIVVFVTDGVSKTIFKTLSFAVGKLTVEEDVVTVGFDAAALEIPVATTVDFTVSTDCDWITVPVATKAMEVREEIVTVNVAANESMDSRTGYVYIVPTEESCASMAITVAVVQKGRATKMWAKEVASYSGYDATQRVRLAQYGEYILLANTTKVYLLDPATGEAVNTIDMPAGFAAHNVLVDDAGNVLIGADALDGAGDVTLYYVADPFNPNPEQLLSWNAGNYYCVGAGNIRVKGNVKDDAVITAVVTDGAGGACLAWEVVDGVVGDWKYTNAPYTNWNSTSICLAPLGATMADGFLYIGYGGDYNLQYTESFVAGGGTAWTVSYVTGSSWMENYNCISTKEWKGNKYAAFVMGCHFAYDATDVVLVNINNPATAQHVYTYNGDGDAAWDWAAGVNNSWTGGGTYSDVLLGTAGDALMMVYVDSNYGTIGCVAIQ